MEHMRARIARNDIKAERVDSIRVRPSLAQLPQNYPSN